LTGKVYAVVEEEGGKVTIETVAEGLKVPNGVAFFQGDLYVAETNRIIKFSNIESNFKDRKGLYMC
jgi:glucose/arabinose dehydrogenase